MGFNEPAQPMPSPHLARRRVAGSATRPSRFMHRPLVMKSHRFVALALQCSRAVAVVLTEEFEQERGRWIYSFEIRPNGETRRSSATVNIDADTGAIETSRQRRTVCALLADRRSGRVDVATLRSGRWRWRFRRPARRCPPAAAPPRWGARPGPGARRPPDGRAPGEPGRRSSLALLRGSSRVRMPADRRSQ